MGFLDVGIDLGTTKVIVTRNDGKELLRIPSIVAISRKEQRLVAVGEKALEMVGRTPDDIRVCFPMEGGVISDYVATEALLEECLRQASRRFMFKQRVVVCVPSSITDVERRAVVEPVIRSGGRKAYLIEEPIAAAIGAGLEVREAEGRMVVDIGGGSADVAVISLSGIVHSGSVRFAGNRLDQEIVRTMSEKFKILIGSKTAEALKKEIATLDSPSPDRKATVKGRNLLSGYPQQMEVSELDLFESVSLFGDAVLEVIMHVLEKTEPELSGDIMENGILLTGGGALLRGLDKMIERRTGIRTYVAEDAVSCVARGTGLAFRYLDDPESFFISEAFYQ